MKLILHELSAAIDSIRRDQLEPTFMMLARVSRILVQLIQSWDVLSTLTPSKCMQFRGQLGYASGFQSVQNRLIEFASDKNRRLVDMFRDRPEEWERLNRAIQEPRIYDVSLQAGLCFPSQRGGGMIGGVPRCRPVSGFV